LIEVYRVPEYFALVDKHRAMVDSCGEGAGPLERSRMVRHFVTSSRYEYMFWDMAYRMEKWLI